MFKGKMLKESLIVVSVAIILRLLPLFSGTNQQDDMMLYILQAQPVINHLNIYQATHKVFPYSPLSMFIPASCLILSDVLRIPFYIIMKIPALLGDILIALSIYLVMAKMRYKYSFYWALLYAVNPLSILISSFHGNIMPLAALFTFLAYAVLLFDLNKNCRLSALLLGIAIGLRGYPILLLPLFVMKIKTPLKNKIEYIMYSLVPAALSFVPFLILDYKSVLREVFGYSGFTDYGPVALIRAALSLKFNTLFYGLSGNLGNLLVPLTKVLFFIFYFYILYLARQKRLLESILLVFLGFYFIYAGVSSQYFIWLLPFAFLIKNKFTFTYIGIASAALVNFYLLYHPRIIFGRLDIGPLPLNKLLLGQIISLSALWLFCGIWIISLVKNNKAKELPLL